MEANEYVGYTLPVVNIGPYSNFQNESIEPEGAGYTLTTIVPEQTLTPNESRIAIPEDEFSLEEGKFYLVMLDDTQYFTTCASMWTENYVIGDANIIFDVSPGSISYPFCAVTTDEEHEICFVDTDSHTIKIELFEFESTEEEGDVM